MANLVTLEGTFYWAQHIYEPTETPFKDKHGNLRWVWKVMFLPTPDSLMQIMDLQSKGVKNQLKKNDNNQYYVNFSRPTKDSAGKALRPPFVFAADGQTVITDAIGNGSKGKLTLDLYEHKTPTGGKANAARLYSITVTDLVTYGGSTPVAETPGSGGWN